MVSARIMCAAASLFAFAAASDSNFLARESSSAQVNAMLDRPRKVAEDLRSTMDSLADELASTHSDSVGYLKEKADAFDAQLAQQLDEIEAVKKQNGEIRSSIKVIKRQNDRMRSQANLLEREHTKLQAKRSLIATNITDAQEFLRAAINSSTELLESRHTSILDDLDAAKLAAEAEAAAKHRMEEVGRFKKHASFLQVDSVRAQRPAEVDDLLKLLDTAASAVRDEKKVHEASLQAAFEERFQAGALRLEKLKNEQAELLQQKKDVRKLHLRLKEAVAHLTDENRKLNRKHQSLKKYMNRLSLVAVKADGEPRK